MSVQSAPKIESLDLSLTDLYGSFYVVPDFQREYVWQPKKLSQDRRSPGVGLALEEAPPPPPQAGLQGNWRETALRDPDARYDQPWARYLRSSALWCNAWGKPRTARRANTPGGLLPTPAAPRPTRGPLQRLRTS